MTIGVQISAAIDDKMARCAAAGNQVQRGKWSAEGRKLASPAYAAALEAIAFDPTRLADMAIYVAVKVRRLVEQHLGIGSADPYTTAIIQNARLDPAATDNLLMRASLSDTVNIKDRPKIRRAGAESTASTQASSTRKALAAIGAMTTHRSGKFGQVQIDFNHPIVRSIP